MTAAQEEAKRQAEVMIAFSEGEEIEYFSGLLEKWQPTRSPVWNFEETQYRIKPKPREPRVIWVNEWSDRLSVNNYPTEQSALLAADARAIATRKFIEVIEEES